MFKRKPLFHMAYSLIAACAVAACSSSPLTKNYERPDLAVPDKLSLGETGRVRGASTSAVTAIDWQAWWRAFQDPVLDAFLQEAASNNQDLVLAAARMTEAHATLSQNQANFFPQVDLNIGDNRTRVSQSVATYSPVVGPYMNSGQVGLSASYEIDFWGKYASANDAARARLLAQTANRGLVLTTLYANVAQSYFSMRALDAQVMLAQQALVTRQESLRLQQRRFDAGVVGELDLRQAESEAASAEAAVRVVQQNRSNSESALALLLGRKPADIMRPVLARGAQIELLVTRQTIPAELPSDVLVRRPDVVSAEQNLIAAHADINQARAAYFPKLSLTASYGQQSQRLTNLFDPASMFWNMLGNLTQPIFRAGAIDAAVAAANARERQAVAQYTQAVQSAFRDVHDALNNVDAGRDLTGVTLQRVDALRRTLNLANLRYKAGYSPYLEVLNAQRDLAQAESGLIDIQRGQLGAVVSLYKAVGGGWDAAKP